MRYILSRELWFALTRIWKQALRLDLEFCTKQKRDKLFSWFPSRITGSDRAQYYCVRVQIKCPIYIWNISYGKNINSKNVSVCPRRSVPWFTPGKLKNCSTALRRRYNCEVSVKTPWPFPEKKLMKAITCWPIYKWECWNFRQVSWHTAWRKREFETCILKILTF
jgi:hypothetical protein